MTSKMYNISKRGIVLSIFPITTTIATTGLSQTIGLFSYVYAHTFTPDDSASFLAFIYRLKDEAQLVQDNLLGNGTNSSNVLAQQHAKNAISILNKTWTKEIAEPNRRITG